MGTYSALPVVSSVKRLAVLWALSCYWQPGTSRNSNPRVHVAAWVDGLIFIMSTPEHCTCEGFAWGCRVCAEYHCRAVEVQSFCKEKAARQRIPLSEKGH